MAEQTDELEPPYKKGSQKKTPPKADHQHEYVRPFYMNRIRRFDGTVTAEKHKFRCKTVCIQCGFSPRRWKVDAVEVEITVREGHKRKKQGL